MAHLLLVCEDLDHNPHWPKLLTRVTQASQPQAQVHACDWQQARSTLEALRRQAAHPSWVVLQARYPEPPHWHFMRCVLRSGPGRPSQAVFWTASRRHPEALRSVAMGGRGFLPMTASEPELCAMWQALQSRASLLPQHHEPAGLIRRRRVDLKRTAPGVVARSYCGGRARLAGQPARPAIDVAQVMEGVPQLHWISAGHTGQSSAAQSARQARILQEPASGWQPGLLSPRKREVFDRMVDLYTYKEIARQLHISAETVKDHARAVLEASGCRHRLELVARWAGWLRRNGRG